MDTSARLTSYVITPLLYAAVYEYYIEHLLFVENHQLVFSGAVLKPGHIHEAACAARRSFGETPRVNTDL